MARRHYIVFPVAGVFVIYSIAESRSRLRLVLKRCYTYPTFLNVKNAAMVNEGRLQAETKQLKETAHVDATGDLEFHCSQ